MMTESVDRSQRPLEAMTPRECWQALHDAAGWVLLESGELYKQCREAGDLETCVDLLRTMVDAHGMLAQARLQLGTGG